MLGTVAVVRMVVSVSVCNPTVSAASALIGVNNVTHMQRKSGVSTIVSTKLGILLVNGTFSQSQFMDNDNSIAVLFAWSDILV